MLQEQLATRRAAALGLLSLFWGRKRTKYYRGPGVGSKGCLRLTRLGRSSAGASGFSPPPAPRARGSHFMAVRPHSAERAASGNNAAGHRPPSAPRCPGGREGLGAAPSGTSPPLSRSGGLGARQRLGAGPGESQNGCSLCRSADRQAHCGAPRAPPPAGSC